jgi:hypothetical protein
VSTTECEIPETVKDFAVAGYTTFFPKVPEGKSKPKVITLVKNDLVTSANVRLCPDLMDCQTQSICGLIAKIIRGLKNTEAMGIDDIPTSVFKKGVEVLAGPISHLVNRSLTEAFKVGKVFPVFKGKQRKDPSSYRQVSILPALSKVLETSVKADLERHLAKVMASPTRSTDSVRGGLARLRLHTYTPDGSLAPRGGRLLALWPSTCLPPSIRWQLSSYFLSSNR